MAASGRVGWWVPVHLALLGAASQAIVGGQLMFSASLGMARGPRRPVALVQLRALNAVTLLVVAGRLGARPDLLGLRAALFAGGGLGLLAGRPALAPLRQPAVPVGHVLPPGA